MATYFRRYRAAAWASLLGFGLWAGSRFVAGTLEPWDAEWPFYSGVMIAGGIAIGVALPRQSVPMFLGLWAGQFFGLLLPGHDRSWLLLGCVTTGIGSLLGVAGYLAGGLARAGWEYFRQGTRPNRASPEGDR